MNGLYRYVQTLRFLKFRQLLFRLFYLLLRKTSLWRFYHFPPIPPQLHPRPFKTKTRFLPYSGKATCDIPKGKFIFLNERVDFGELSRIDWQCPRQGRLWRYNLHYFQYLLLPEGPLPVDRVYPLLRDWIAKNPVGQGDAWDPFPVSLRIVNWIKYLTIAMRSRNSLDWRPVLASLYRQTAWLERFVEYHLLGNHLFKNGKALLFAGLFFKEGKGPRWLQKGSSLLTRELAEQILADGGHFERSPMYHAMILEDILDLINVTDLTRPKPPRLFMRRLHATARRMMTFLIKICHPDHLMPLFNDAAFGIEATTPALADYYQRVKGTDYLFSTRPHYALPQTGLFVMAPSPKHKLIIDCGPIGPDYQTGHAHADTLSFELSLHHQRIIVDSGCYTYWNTELRRYNRGTAGHNTIRIDHCEQSEVWGAHRCGRRARAFHTPIQCQKDGALVWEGLHGGYRRLPGKPIHKRRIVWQKKHLSIQDTITGQGAHAVSSFLHIHPAIQLQRHAGDMLLFRNGRQIARISPSQGGVLGMENGWYCSEFGLKRSCSVLKHHFDPITLPLTLGWVFTILD